jgi:hypothetical protein
MPDPFDAIRATTAANQDAVAAVTGPAGASVFDRVNAKQPDPLRAIAHLGSQMAPERAAKVVALRDRTGLPSDLIDRNLDEVEAEARRPDFNPDAYRKSSPKVAAWLSEQPEHFAIASDDLPRLAAVERMVSESDNYAWDKGGAILGPMQGNNRTYYRSTADLLVALKEQQNLAVVDDVQRRMRAEQAQDRSPFAAGFLTAGGSTLRLAQMAGDALTGGDRADATKRQVERIGEVSAINDPGFLADVQRGLGGLAADAPLMLAGAALTPLTRLKAAMGGGKLAGYAAGAAATAIAVQPLALREGILTGADDGWANGLTSWGIETVIPAAFGTTGTEKIITGLLSRGIAKEAAPSLARVAGRLLMDAGLEATEEAVTEYAHAIHEVASGINPGALDPDQLWPRLGVAGAVGGIAGGGFNLPGAIASMGSRGTLDRDAQRLIQAASGQQTVAGIFQAATDSATVGRSPEAARTLFQSLVADSTPQLYVDREAWDAHWRGQNQDPRAKLLELGGDAKTYDEAATTGSPLVLQTGRLAVDVAKDKATQDWLSAEARLDPSMMNAREAGEAVKAMETVPDDPEAKVQQTAQEAAQAVQDDVEQQLLAAGYDAGSARRNAVQMGAVFRTMAARWNAGRTADDPGRLDAKALFQEWNVGINRPLPEVLTAPTTKGAESIIAARRARLAGDQATAGMDAERIAAQSAADQSLAQEAASDAGFALIQEATAVLETAGEQMTMGDAMRALGPAFGFRPDSTAPMTTEQAKRGNLLAAALRVRGKSLADLIQDAGVAKPDPVATTAAGQTAPVKDDPRLEKLAADALRLVDLAAAIRAGKGDLAEMEQAAALAAEVGPELDRLPLDQARIEDVRAAVEFAQEGRTLNQRKDRRRGSITFGRRNGNRQTDIRLFEHADLSTMLHESGHLYLELLGDLAGRENAPQEIKDDYAQVLTWLGSDGKITTEQHEKWARGFEAYLMEGKSPSAELRGAFARFAAWLSALYKSVKSLAVDLSPEVRGVMDRLLATQEEISEARNFLVDDPIFADALSAGMTPDQFATYQKAREDARRQAENELRTTLMTEMRREQTEAYQEIRVEVAKEVESEVNRAKEYVAESILRRGELPGGVPLPPNMPAVKIDTADLKRRIAGGKIPKTMIGMHAKEGGIPADQAAQILGFGSADELIQTMAGLRPRRQLIEAETDVRIRQRFGDSLTDGSLAEQAMAALHNERQADVHLAEVRALGLKVGKKVAPIEVMRQAAQAKVAATPVKDLLPQIHARAERKARQALEKALAKQDFAGAWIAKQQEILASELYRASIDAKREADAILAFAKKFGENKTRERIGKAGGWEWTVTRPDGSTKTYPTEDEARAAAATVTGATFARTSGYLEQIDGLMERYEFRRVSIKTIDRRASLRQWVAEQMATGAPVSIPDSVINGAERKNWRQVPLSELRGVRDALSHIAHLAKKKNELSKAHDKRELDSLAGLLRATLARTHPTENPPDAESKPGLWPSFIAAHRKAANVAREMDGDEDIGPFWAALIKPFNDAATAEAAMMREAKTKQEALWDRWAKEVRGDGWPPGERRQFAGFKGGLTRMGGIMVALNWGNEGNRQRLMEGGQGMGKLTEPQVQAVLDSLTAADWNLVEDIWSHVDSYWSEIAALEQRVTGVKPEKVDPSPFPTKHGTIKGGYFPIIYDGQETGRIDGEATDLAKQIQAQAFGRTATAHGHTKARSIGQGRRLKLDVGGVGNHLSKVIHDLTHREALADAMRILLHDDVRSAIDARMGNATAKALRQWIADIATGGTPPDAVARGIGWLRRGFSISTMGFKAMTAALQLTGFSNSAMRVGPARMARAIATLFSQHDGQSAYAFIDSKSKTMRERASTQTRELNELVNQFQQGKAQRFQEAVGTKAFWMMRQVQTVVDSATWLAAYEKAIDEGRTDAQAVDIADQTVIDTQSGGQTKDLSGVQRSPFAQILTGAYTYGSLVFNQLYDQGARVRRNPKDFGTWAGAFGNVTLAALLPAAMSVALRALLRSDWPDDDDRKDGVGRRYAAEMASTLLGTMVITRELGGAVSGFDYAGPGVTKPLADLTKLGHQAMQGDLDAGLARAVVNTLGSAFGLPSAQAWATGSGLMEWIDEPSADVRPIIFGPPPRR